MLRFLSPRLILSLCMNVRVLYARSRGLLISRCRRRRRKSRDSTLAAAVKINDKRLGVTRRAETKS